MAVFFKPSDITTKVCSVNNLTRGGSAFAVCEDGEQVFIPPKIVDMSGIEVGDYLTAYCIDNHRPENAGEERYPVRWRAIRLTVTEKFTVTPPAPPVVAAPEPLSTADMVAAIRDRIQQDRAWTAAQMADAIGVDVQRVSNFLFREHEQGHVASIRIYASGDQERASFVYYGRTAQLLIDLIDEVELGDE